MEGDGGGRSFFVIACISKRMDWDERIGVKDRWIRMGLVGLLETWDNMRT